MWTGAGESSKKASSQGDHLPASEGESENHDSASSGPQESGLFPRGSTDVLHNVEVNL